MLQNMYLPTMPEVCEFKSELELMGTYYSEQLRFYITTMIIIRSCSL